MVRPLTFSSFIWLFAFTTVSWAAAPGDNVFRACTEADLTGTFVSKDVYYAPGFAPTDARYSEFMLRFPTQAYDFRADGSMIHQQIMFEHKLRKHTQKEIDSLRAMRHLWKREILPNQYVVERNPGGDIKDVFACDYVMADLRSGEFKVVVNKGNMIFSFYDLDEKHQPVKIGMLLMEKWK